VYTQVNVGNVGWVERQRNPIEPRIMLGFVPQPNLRYSGFFDIGTQTIICVYTVAQRARGKFKVPLPLGEGFRVRACMNFYLTFIHKINILVKVYDTIMSPSFNGMLRGIT